MIARIKTNLIKYFFFGNSITDDGYLRLAYLVGRFIVFLPLSLCTTLILSIYSIFRPVKIFMLRCDRSKISFVVEDLEVALRIEAHNNQVSGRRSALLFAVLDCDSPNSAFTAMYGRVLPFLDDKKFFIRGIIRYTLPLFRIRREYLKCWQAKDQMEIWANQGPVNSFTIREINIGKQLEGEIRKALDKEFVCIGLPEKIYYETKIENEHPIALSHDLYSGMPTWQTYNPSAQALINLNYDVIRMGQIVGAPLGEIGNPGIIDYASKYRSEFGDVWLLANCKFAISGNGTGFYWICEAFNVPTLTVDAPSALHKSSYGVLDLFTPQLAWSRSEKKLMSFSWMTEQGEAWTHKRSLIEGDIEVVKNTADEVTEVVLEMHQRIDGTWNESEEDIELQKRFRQLRILVPSRNFQRENRIGADFLRRYQHLL